MKCVLSLLIILCASLANAQTKVKLDTQGNYVSTADPKKAVVIPTGKVFIDPEGKQFQVFTNSKGRPFIIRKSKKTGKEYKQYLDVIY